VLNVIHDLRNHISCVKDSIHNLLPIQITSKMLEWLYEGGSLINTTAQMNSSGWITLLGLNENITSKVDIDVISDIIIVNLDVTHNINDKTN